MQRKPLYITLVQADIHWKGKAENREMYDRFFERLSSHTDLIVLPEMGTTGFVMDPEGLAESLDGETIQWLRERAASLGCVITGSFIIADSGRHFNRLVWMQPDGHVLVYDKRHLFAFAGEHAKFSAGTQRIVADLNGWRICPLVCYDLRFPVWSRNQVTRTGQTEEWEPTYDALIYVANWPERRSYAWRQLLIARAIENQSYVIGVNRTGTDGTGVYYSGDSMLVSPFGEVIWSQSHQAGMQTLMLQPNQLEACRSAFPFLQDSDLFTLHI